MTGVFIMSIFFFFPVSNQTTITFSDGSQIQAEIVRTEQTREKGLSGRKTLQKNHGMLFLFDESQQRGIWMKGMWFSIDILWLREGKIVSMVEHAPIPVLGESIPTFRPDVLASEVLELPDGFISEHGLREGDEVKIK